MDGEKPGIWDVHAGSTDWTWDLLNHRESGKDPRAFKLTRGQHTLVIRSRESGTRIDRIVIQNHPSAEPPE